MIRALLLLSALGYAGAWLVQLRGFRGGGEALRARSLRLAGGATFLHAAGLVALWVVHRAPPLLGFGPTSATLAFATAVGLLAVAPGRERWTAGLLALPFILVLLLVALWAGLSPAPTPPGFRGGWSVVHVVSVVIAYASLLLASIAAAMYLLQFRALKEKEFGNVFRFFPSLDSLDRMSALGIAAGLGALTVGLITGWSFTLTFGQGLALGNPDVVFGLVTWVGYAVALAAHRSRVGRGPRSALVTVLAFAASAAAFLALKARDPSSEFFL